MITIMIIYPGRQSGDYISIAISITIISSINILLIIE